MTDLTNDQLFTYQQDFNEFDVNGSGSLEPGEVKKLLKHQLQDRDPTQKEIDDFMAGADLNADGKLSLHEYISSVMGGADWTVDGKPHDQLAWYKVSGAAHAIWKSYQQLIPSASELEARAVAGLKASGARHAEKFAVSKWEIEPKYLVGMYVQVQKVYRKHAYVKDSDGNCVWVPLTAFVDPSFYGGSMHPEIPELVKEASLEQDPEELQKWMREAAASEKEHAQAFSFGIEEWDDEDFKAVAGCCVQVYYEPEERRMVEADVVCRVGDDIYSFFTGAGLTFANQDLYQNVPRERLERMLNSKAHEQFHISQDQFDDATDGHTPMTYGTRNGTMAVHNYKGP